MGRQLTKTEINDFKRRLSEWQSPSSFEEIYRSARMNTGQYMMIMKDSFLRDSHIAIACAQALSSNQVRLGADPPDFELKIDGEIRGFEATEALRCARRRTDEYKASIEDPENDSTLLHDTEDIVQENICAVAAVIAQADRKALKYENPDFELVIYQNCGWSGHEEDAFLQDAFNLLRYACKKFSRVWIFSNPGGSGSILKQVSDNGEAISNDASAS